VQEGNEGLVHHLLIYECHGKFNQSLYGSGFDCHNTANMPLTQCYYSSVVAAWGVGGEVRAIGLALKTILNKMANVLFPLSFFPIFRPFFFATSLLSFLVVLFFLFHLLLCHYPGILLPAKSWLSNWNCGFS